MGRVSSTFPQKSKYWSPVIISILKGIPFYIRIHFRRRFRPMGITRSFVSPRATCGRSTLIYWGLHRRRRFGNICNARRAVPWLSTIRCMGQRRSANVRLRAMGTRATSDPISELPDNGTAVTPTRNCFSASAALRHSIFPMHLIAFFRTCPYLDNPVTEVAQCCDRLQPCMK